MTEEVETLDSSLPGPHAPRELVQPVSNYDISSPSFLEENIVVADFGQSYDITAPPKGYKPATALHYFSPEARLDNVVTPLLTYGGWRAPSSRSVLDSRYSLHFSLLSLRFYRI